MFKAQIDEPQVFRTALCHAMIDRGWRNKHLIQACAVRGTRITETRMSHIINKKGRALNMREVDAIVGAFNAERRKRGIKAKLTAKGLGL